MNTKLKEKYGKSIAIISQACESRFNCKITQVMIIGHYNVPQRYSEMPLSSANRNYIPNSSQLTYHSSAAEKMVPDKLNV